MYPKLLLKIGTCLALTFSAAAQNPKSLQIQNVENNLDPQLLKNGANKINGQPILKRMQARKVNGLSIAVIDKGELAWAKGYGINDASAPTQLVDTTTLFQCASIGKVITAIAALQLVQDQKIGLDDDVNQKLVSWKIPENNFTAQKR